ncbi:NADPH:quinone reductase-like Zn-dependent oxidoreductase [Prauserella shujinwangii]|uniref:NADPH:quinone reductase-like Zn-dependent oxidoreductase n=1 Tax=Prauserella shujinwangii TaxID=1453103 RepID=A0A2T0LKZ6_9PSEU|nr:NAD(P)-dependent alcohol dehydrogenase [Prauserella shujinwangii]PRX43616.1 NADPH:quinone reductase-like Zn-dependent oxidoreductase [Prauserella shujinwangii]
MRAIVQHEYGSPDVLRFAEVDRPRPGDGEVLVRVRAASVNARDWHLMRGDPAVARLLSPSVFGLRGPRSPIRGSDFAGTVEETGPGVSGLRPGDEVYGYADGSFAEYVCAPAGSVCPKPVTLSFAEAAAVPLAASTALVALRDVGRAGAGDRVLVNGASGGVGTFAVQIGKILGSEVTGVCGARNVELVGSAGADHVIDYRRDDFTRGGLRYDVVLDLVANRSVTALRRAVKRDGTAVLAGGGVSEGGSLFRPFGLIVRSRLVAPFVPQRLALVDAPPTQETLTGLRDLVEAGRLRPVIDRTYPLSKAAEAIRYLEDEHARAKVVLVV